MADTQRQSSQVAQRALRRRVVLGIIAAIAVAAGIRLYLSLEWIEEEIDLGYSAAARRNPFLAAQEFLEDRGHPVHVLRSHSALDQMAWQAADGTDITPNDLVILVNSYRVLRGQRLENLWQWLQGGGRLVASSHNPFIDADAQREDLLLARLPITVVEAALQPEIDDAAADDEAQEGTSTDNGKRGYLENLLEELSQQDAGEGSEDEAQTGACARTDDLLQVVDQSPGSAASVPFDVGYMAGLRYVPEPGVDLRWHTVDAPHRLLRFAQGAGDIALVGDANIWNNGLIGCADHAYALARLAENRETVWIIVNMDAPSLWRLLWRSAPFAVILLCLALLLWLWAQGKRSVPTVPAPPASRRSFVEHVRAGAMFLWRNKQHRELVERVRSDLLQTARHRFPAFGNKKPQQQAAFISQRTGLPLSEVENALLAPPPATPEAFTRVVHRLQYIRNNL